MVKSTGCRFRATGWFFAGYTMNARESAEEKISALIDGEINYRAFHSTLTAMKDQSGQNSWDLYHHIGDILRSEKNAGNSSDAFMQRFNSRFENELPHGQPVRVIIDIPKACPESTAIRVRPSVLSTLFDWRFALPGAAALGAAIVAFVSAPVLTTSDLSVHTALPEPTVSSAGILKAGNDGKTAAVTLVHPAEPVIAIPGSETGLQNPELREPLAGHQPVSSGVYRNGSESGADSRK